MGSCKTKLNTVNIVTNVTVWVHKECDIMDQDALCGLQGAWESPEQKNECVARMNDFERDSWLGTEFSREDGGFKEQLLA